MLGRLFILSSVVFVFLFSTLPLFAETRDIISDTKIESDMAADFVIDPDGITSVDLSLNDANPSTNDKKGSIDSEDPEFSPEVTASNGCTCSAASDRPPFGEFAILLLGAMFFRRTFFHRKNK